MDSSRHEVGESVPITAGAMLRPLPKGPYSASQVVRWCAAQQNWDRIHYDLEYAQQYAGLKERVVNGALKQHLLVQFLETALPAGAWIRRLNFRFVGPDLIGEALEVHGTVRSVDESGMSRVIVVDLGIRNVQQDKDTTAGWALVVLRGSRSTDSDLPAMRLPEQFVLDESVEAATGPVPAEVAALVGTEAEQVESAYPLDLSRLRLFADAVGGLRPMYFNPGSGRESPYGTVVAPPLFPVHGLEAEPDSLPLSNDPAAMGREGVNEIGRNLGRRFGFPSSGMVNGGSDIEITSLLRVGESVCATSRLLAANVKSSAKSGHMLLTTALNTYRTSTGRLLLKEKQTTVYRNFI